MASSAATDKPVGNSLQDVVKGSFVRKDSQFRNFIRNAADSEFRAESGRYHLYVSYACPWAHRTLIVRALKGLDDVIGVSVVSWRMFERGWTFDQAPGVIADENEHVSSMRELYHIAQPDYSGRYTVPVLWDKKRRTIVNNESSEIIRMLNSEFNAFAKNPSLDLYPEAHRAEIDKWNAYVYPNINNGVYRCGFATTQEAYEAAFDELFAALDKVEAHLSSNRYLSGQVFTEADVRLFTTLIRFDPVYHGHFKCNRQLLRSFPNIYQYMKEIYQMNNVRPTVHFDHIKGHYYESHRSINGTGIVPKGPLLDDLNVPHQRARLPAISA